MQFSPYFPHMSSDVDGIWYKRSALNAVEHLWASVKMGAGISVLYSWARIKLRLHVYRETAERQDGLRSVHP